jgi:inosose dehydratase
MTPHHTNQDSSGSRRHFLQWSSAAAVALMAAEQTSKADDPAKSKKREKLNLGVTSYSFRALSLDKALAMTQRLALKHISLKSMHMPLNSTPEQIADIAAKVRHTGLDLYGVGVISMHKPGDVTQAFTYAKAAGVRVIMAMPTAALLPLIEQKVKETNIAVAIHNHGPQDRNFPTPESAYRKIKHLDRRVGLCIDVGHTLHAGADPVASVLKFGDRLLDMHMKDVSAPTRRDREVIVGRGVLDVPGLVRALEKIKYRGNVSFEYEPDQKDPLPGMAESVGYTRGVMAAVG